METPSAPRMNLCSICQKNPIEDYLDDQFVQYVKEKFSNVRDCREFVINCRLNSNLDELTLNKCKLCLITNWKYLQNKQNCKRTLVQELRKKYNSKSLYNILLITSSLLALFFLPFFSSEIYSMFSNGNHLSLSENTLKSIVTNLKVKFPSQQSILKKMNGAFLRLKSPGEPFIFLLLHDDTNKMTTDCLALSLSIEAKQNIFTSTAKSLWMNGSEWTQFSAHDRVILDEKLITPLKENEVLILENLQDLPWLLAKSFHKLCDAENPQIAKAMYILELRVNNDNLQNLNDHEKLMVAEQTLKSAWVNATNSYRVALVTRLTSYVDAVLLKSDQECPTPLSLEESFIRISP